MSYYDEDPDDDGQALRDERTERRMLEREEKEAEERRLARLRHPTGNRRRWSGKR